jgi:hypothetical protein
MTRLLRALRNWTICDACGKAGGHYPWCEFAG